MDFLDINQLYYVIRMIAAGLCGIFIGLERRNRSKEAGVRTHCVVACASALMMIISKYGFFDLVGADGVNGADGARIAAQVVSGIGFLGAGMIFVHKNTITGLTTAAGIWATAGVGMAIGAGMYVVGIASSLIIVFAQIVLHKNIRRFKNPKLKTLQITNVTAENYQQYIIEQFAKYDILIYDVDIKKDTDGISYKLTIEIPPDINEDNIISLIDYNCAISANI